MKSYEENESNADIVDYKITKTHFPHTNTKKNFEFIIEKDPNLFLRKNKIAIRGTIQLPKKYCPCTNWASKLFQRLTVDVESQTVSKNQSE